jgi:hypothetical protein
MFYSIKVRNFTDIPSIFSGYFTQLINIIKEKAPFYFISIYLGLSSPVFYEAEWIFFLHQKPKKSFYI